MLAGRLKIAVLVLLAVASLIYLRPFYMTEEKHSEEKKFLDVKISGFEVRAEIADTPQKRTLGLSGRESLGVNGGMLFVFSEEAHRQFWMKDMRFALDIIWLDENKKITDITKDASPESFPEKFSPVNPARYVLEVNAGFADSKDLKIGDQAEF